MEATILAYDKLWMWQGRKAKVDTVEIVKGVRSSTEGRLIHYSHGKRTAPRAATDSAPQSKSLLFRFRSYRTRFDASRRRAYTISFLLWQ